MESGLPFHEGNELLDSWMDNLMMTLHVWKV